MEYTNLTLELKSHFIRLYQMALADGNFDVLELQMLYQFANERGIPNSELDKLFLSPSNHDAQIPRDLNTRIEFLYDLTCMIWADKIVTDDEYNTLIKYCKKFEFLEENVEELANYLIQCVKDGVKKQDIINQLNS